MTQEQKTLKLKSLPESIHQVERLIEEICDDFNLNHNYLGCITVALTEAFTNALEHGNKKDPDKSITIDFQKTSTGLSFSIKDEGKGFDFKSFPDMKDGGKEKVFPGRGLFLIKTLADEVNFNNTGNEIEMGFKISSINIETAIDRIEKFKNYSKAAQEVV
ncbi:MAG: ATP-binding protein [Bacteroidetes bacterium]|nr:ATP-binding protein [Bacteroidota bacterium]MBL7105430.1 ATP-binding protein [Bacteroidales bacterium]